MLLNIGTTGLTAVKQDLRTHKQVKYTNITLSKRQNIGLVVNVINQFNIIVGFLIPIIKR
tara:strand:- start:887 stop:1066 length:180 start_codon:yes stop_codon:yes gene_type:complete